MPNQRSDAMMDLNTHLPPLTTDISVSRCHLDDDRDMALSVAWSLLSADETTRARRFRFDRDRNRYARGRGFLRSVLGQLCGQDSAGLIFGIEAQGKPFLQNRGWAFNLSHSRDLAVLAVSQSGPLGIDLEFIDREVDSAGLAQRCFCPHEIDALMAIPQHRRSARFFDFWTAKEARMKLTGEGMTLAPEAIMLDLRDGRPVGYLRPEAPAAQALFLDLGDPAAICCLALPQGPIPVIRSLSLHRAYHVA